MGPVIVLVVGAGCGAHVHSKSRPAGVCTHTDGRRKARFSRFLRRAPTGPPLPVTGSYPPVLRPGAQKPTGFTLSPHFHMQSGAGGPPYSTYTRRRLWCLCHATPAPGRRVHAYEHRHGGGAPVLFSLFSCLPPCWRSRPAWSLAENEVPEEEVRAAQLGAHNRAGPRSASRCSSIGGGRAAAEELRSLLIRPSRGLTLGGVAIVGGVSVHDVEHPCAILGFQLRGADLFLRHFGSSPGGLAD